MLLKLKKKHFPAKKERNRTPAPNPRGTAEDEARANSASPDADHADTKSPEQELLFEK